MGKLKKVKSGVTGILNQRVRSCAIELPAGQHYKDGARHGLFPELDTDPVSV